MESETERRRTNLDAVLNPGTPSEFNKLPNPVFEDKIFNRKDVSDKTQIRMGSS